MKIALNKVNFIKNWLLAIYLVKDFGWLIDKVFSGFITSKPKDGRRWTLNASAWTDVRTVIKNQPSCWENSCLDHGKVASFGVQVFLDNWRQWICHPVKTWSGNSRPYPRKRSCQHRNLTANIEYRNWHHWRQSD